MDFVKIFEKQTNIFQPLMSSKLNLNFIPTISHANKGCIHYEKELLRGGGVELMFIANISANHDLRQLFRDQSQNRNLRQHFQRCWMILICINFCVTFMSKRNRRLTLRLKLCPIMKLNICLTHI